MKMKKRTRFCSCLLLLSLLLALALPAQAQEGKYVALTLDDGPPAGSPAAFWRDWNSGM